VSEPTNDLPELDLDALDEAPAAPEGAAPAADGAELVAEPAPGAAAATATASDAPADDADPSAGGQWVWQFAAPAPPPSFGAKFFSGTALPELYRFFGCGLLVVIGCLLPWGPVTSEVPNPALETDPAASSTIEQVLELPDRLGVQTTLGAVSLVIGLWLVFSSLYGIYTRRQKILPVFLMLEPAIVSWLLLLKTKDSLGAEAGILSMLDAAGTGVLLTLVGSTLVSLQFLFVVGKVYAKKDDKGAARKGARSSKGKDAKGKSGKGKQGDAASDAAAASDASDGKDGKAEGGKGRRGKRR